MVTSNVPPPRSYTRIVRRSSTFIPYEIAAAVGSLIIANTLRPALIPACLVCKRSLLPKYAGQVITTSVIGSGLSPKLLASCTSFLRISAEISTGSRCMGVVFLVLSKASSLPISRLINATVFSGSTANWFLASLPTIMLLSDSMYTTEGVVASPSKLRSTTAWSYRSTCAIQLNVVPKSMPYTALLLSFAIVLYIFYLFTLVFQF